MSARYASSMIRAALCARPGCHGPAEAWLAYDYGTKRVWLDGDPGAGAGDQWGLCSTHAERLRAPKGWSQVDRRIGKADRLQPRASLAF